MSEQSHSAWLESIAEIFDDLGLGAQATDILIPVVDYQHRALARATDHVLTAEDVVIHKLIAWRLRDRDDIRSILEAATELNDEYLRQWIDEWDLADRWETFF